MAKACSLRPRKVEATRPPKKPLIAVETLDTAVLAPKATYSFRVSFSFTSVARVFLIFLISHLITVKVVLLTLILPYPADKCQAERIKTKSHYSGCCNDFSWRRVRVQGGWLFMSARLFSKSCYCHTFNDNRCFLICTQIYECKLKLLVFHCKHDIITLS